jgi:hypothetical protein
VAILCVELIDLSLFHKPPSKLGNYQKAASGKTWKDRLLKNKAVKKILDFPEGLEGKTGIFHF